MRSCPTKCLFSAFPSWGGKSALRAGSTCILLCRVTAAMQPGQQRSCIGPGGRVLADRQAGLGCGKGSCVHAQTDKPGPVMGACALFPTDDQPRSVAASKSVEQTPDKKVTKDPRTGKGGGPVSWKPVRGRHVTLSRLCCSPAGAQQLRGGGLAPGEDEAGWPRPGQHQAFQRGRAGQGARPVPLWVGGRSLR